MRSVSSVKQAGVRLNVGSTTVYKLLKTCQLKSTVIGRHRVIFDDSIDALLAGEA